MVFPFSKKPKVDDEEVLEGGLTYEQIQKERQEYVDNIRIEYRYGCYEEKRADSCQLLGEYLETVEQNFADAFQLFRDNCEQKKWPRSCYKYATYLLRGRECEPSISKAIGPLEVASDANLAGGCKILALIHWNASHDREPDPVKAEQLMRRACELDDFEACWILSTWHMGKMAKFVDAKKGGGPGGTTAARPLEQRTGHLPRDMEKALQYGIRACDEGSVVQSCMNVSRIYRLGDGVAKDPEKSKHYAERAKELHKLLTRGVAGTGFTG